MSVVAAESTWSGMHGPLMGWTERGNAPHIVISCLACGATISTLSSVALLAGTEITTLAGKLTVRVFPP